MQENIIDTSSDLLPISFEDIDNENLEPLEGGFEQRIHDLKRKQRSSRSNCF